MNRMGEDGQLWAVATPVSQTAPCIPSIKAASACHALRIVISRSAGGWTRAARQLQRSQPAITRRIKLLEDHLGAPLLERGRGGAMLTEAGRTFLPYAEAVLAALKDGTQAVQALRESDHGAVSLAIVGTLAGTTLVERFRRVVPPPHESAHPPRH